MTTKNQRVLEPLRIRIIKWFLRRKVVKWFVKWFVMNYIVMKIDKELWNDFR